ncbi:MAG: hypothetical protein D6743_09235 [Calditrichaeota bacterium]|nr:MAG: hypothetical protein D6743_09235 [Calditrichota bacterium]
MKIIESFRQGFQKVNQARRFIFLIYATSLLLALVLGGSMMLTLQRSIGNSAAGERLLERFDPAWYQNFSSQAQGLARTFTPSVVGIGAVFNGLDAFLRGDVLKSAVAVTTVGLLYLLLWTFFSGGLVSLYAAEGKQPSFFQEAARFFPRFLVLGIMAGVLYVLLFKFLFGWMSKAVEELTRETIDERVHFAYTVVKYVLFWSLVLSVNIVFDYSKIFTVLRDHRNALSAPLKALKIVFGRFGRTYGLYLTLGATWVVLMLLYWLVVPGAGQSRWLTIAAAFLLGQLYVLGRIWMRGWFYASQTVLCDALAGQEKLESAAE